MNTMKSIVLALVAMVMLFGCATHENPVMPVQNAQSATANQELSAPMTTPVPILTAVPILVPLPLPIAGPQRLVSKTQRISASEGGRIEISYAYWSLLGKVSRYARLEIPEGALEKDTDITMAFDTQVLGLRFSPEGLVFKSPAILDFNSRGLDLRNLLAGTLYDLYYDSETGLFERQDAYEMKTNLLKGEIDCKEGEIHHFSRYAFGR